MSTLVLLSCLVGGGCGGRGPLISNHGYEIDSVPGNPTSWKELDESAVVMQEEDYSCGAASLATLMHYYFGDPITESTVLDLSRTLFTGVQRDVIRSRGLSFGELEAIAKSLGYTASSVDLEFETLLQVNGPVLVYIEPYRYPHFAVLRGVRDGRAYLADPSRGNIRMSTAQFSKEWTGKALVLGKPGFGTPADHSLAVTVQPDVMQALRTARSTIR